MRHLTLGEVIERLETEDPERVLPLGFNEPHAYRGYYEQLAFEPAVNISVGEMLNVAREALGTTYQGYKGGEFTMDSWTPCWLANFGELGETIGAVFLSLLLLDRTS